MTETATGATAADSDVKSVLDALAELMRSGVRPDLIEAQRQLLQRLASTGDVFPSRVPPPKTITEVGGYLNLLESMAEQRLRLAAVTAALGVATPGPAANGLADGLVGFAAMPNDRPAGHPQTPSVPPVLQIRADLYGPLLAALTTLRGHGCLVPLRVPPTVLPAASPGAAPGPGLPADTMLALLGRVIEVFPGMVLGDPAIDPLLIARDETAATSAFQLYGRAAGDLTVPEASWIAKRASLTAVTDDPPAAARLVPIAPEFEAAGWYQPAPLVLPVSLTERGTLARFVNVTGLIAGETTLNDELGALYAGTAIARSQLAAMVAWIWDGTAFKPPA